MTSQNLNSTTDMNELNGGNIDHLLNIKNLLERLDQIGIQQVDVQQQLTTMSLKDTQKAIDDTIKAIKKNNDTEDDRYIQALQELQKDPTNRRKAWEIKIAMEKQKINQNLKNITNEEYGDDANTLRINEINKLVALTNGDDLRNMKEELVLNLGNYGISEEDIMMLANIQDLMLDGTKKLNIEEAFFIALGMYTYTNKKGNKIPINKDDLVKIENGECSRKGRLEQASERYRMGEEMYKNPGSTREKIKKTIIEEGTTFSKRNKLKAVKDHQRYKDLRLRADTGEIRIPNNKPEDKNSKSENENRETYFNNCAQEYKQIIDQANPLIQKAGIIKKYLSQKMCKERGIIPEEKLINILNNNNSEYRTETMTLGNKTRSNGINGIDGYGLFHGDIDLEQSDRNTQKLEINQEFGGNMIIDIQGVDNTGGTFTIQNPNNEKEKITLTCSLETGKGFKWEINGTINGIQIEQLNATAVKIDFAPESALSQFNFIQQANDGNGGDLEEIFVTTSYRRIRNVTVAPNPEHALGGENKELGARGLTDFLQNQIQQAKENTKGQPFIKLNLATSVDITRINPKSDKYKEGGACYQYVQEFLNAPTTTQQEKDIIKKIYEDVKKEFSNYMKTHPKDRRGNEYNKENEADQQAILAAGRGVTLLIKLREEGLLNDETEIVSTSEVTKSERYISFSGDSIQG